MDWEPRTTWVKFLHLLAIGGLALATACSPKSADATPTQIPDKLPTSSFQTRTISPKPTTIVSENLVCATINSPTIPNAYRAALAARGDQVGLDEPAILILNDSQTIEAKLKDLNLVWNGNQVCISKIPSNQPLK